jgi:hypothetical protein
MSARNSRISPSILSVCWYPFNCFIAPRLPVEFHPGNSPETRFPFNSVMLVSHPLDLCGPRRVRFVRFLIVTPLVSRKNVPAIAAANAASNHMIGFPRLAAGLNNALAEMTHKIDVAACVGLLVCFKTLAADLGLVHGRKDLLTMKYPTANPTTATKKYQISATISPISLI